MVVRTTRRTVRQLVARTPCPYRGLDDSRSFVRRRKISADNTADSRGRLSLQDLGGDRSFVCIRKVVRTTLRRDASILRFAPWQVCFANIAPALQMRIFQKLYSLVVGVEEVHRLEKGVRCHTDGESDRKAKAVSPRRGVGSTGEAVRKKVNFS